MSDLRELASQIHGLDEVGGCELMEVEAQWLQSTVDSMRQAADRIEQLERENEELEAKLLSKEFQQAIDWQDEIKHLHERCERLNKTANDYKQERDELAESVDRFAAMFDRLRSAINRIDSPSTGYCEAAIHEVFRLIDESPQTSLAEVKAREIEVFAESLVESGGALQITGAAQDDSYFESGKILRFANQHAQQTRNGKDGE